MLAQIEESLDLMITLKDALQYYGDYLKERMQKCDDASGNMPGFITQIEGLVVQETELIQEIGNLGEQVSEVNRRLQSMQEDVQIANELDSLEVTIREREQAKEDLMSRLNIGTARAEGIKGLDLDILAMAELRDTHLKSLKDRGIDRTKLRERVPSLEAHSRALTDGRVRKEAESRELGQQRQQLMQEFNEFKGLKKERRMHEISSENLEKLMEIVNKVSLDVTTIQPEQEALVGEGVRSC